MAAILTKDTSKEEDIIRAAEKVFFSVGFANAKMEDIAKTAGYSKVTVYSYFGSKENLYMALTHKAMQHLIDGLYDCLDRNKGKSGLDTFIAMAENYLCFCVKYRHYVDLMLNYLSIVRMTVAGEALDKISQAMQSSIYYRKIRGIQNVTIDLTVEEIKRGQADGSIKTKKSPWLLHHMMWSMITGYAKVNYQPSADEFINADNNEWKKLMIDTVRGICLGRI
ncbi:MAG TPA: TetR/AcrR family transcriptional regulator [Bacteroidetes bacterium]|nr:TetR/AcrR family transcriptional regulator [Bacteroidota bacterium]